MADTRCSGRDPGNADRGAVGLSALLVWFFVAASRASFWERPNKWMLLAQPIAAMSGVVLGTSWSLIFALVAAWSLFGRQIFSDLVDVTFAMTRLLHEKLESSADFEPLHVPQCNIQAFRYIPDYARDWPPEKLGEFQLDVRRQVITSGTAYIVPAKFDGIGALRATLINPCTTEDDIEAVLQAIRDCASKL